MPFLQLTLDIGAADPAPFEDALLAAGAVSITLQDAADDPVLEPAPGTTPLWPSVRVSALFDAPADPDILREVLRNALPAPLPALHFQDLADRAWEREWLKDFRPMLFGKRLWICPGGQRPPEANASTQLTPVIVELDPGLAFGTGTHPTTALCLQWLDGADLSGKTVIDYGCGSGVLAIAALKLGAAAAFAVDIDPQAVTATADNAHRNGVAERLHVGTVAQMTLPTADIVLANILAEPLQSLAPTLTSLVRNGGRIVLSGLLAHQADAVAAPYAAGFELSPVATQGEWARLDGVRLQSSSRPS
jgi:ribosomal protein L11 methyltransferase